MEKLLHNIIHTTYQAMIYIGVALLLAWLGWKYVKSDILEYQKQLDDAYARIERIKSADTLFIYNSRSESVRRIILSPHEQLMVK
jgi:hypothetical protein